MFKIGPHVIVNLLDKSVWTSEWQMSRRILQLSTPYTDHIPSNSPHKIKKKIYYISLSGSRDRLVHVVRVLLSRWSLIGASCAVWSAYSVTAEAFAEVFVILVYQTVLYDTMPKLFPSAQEWPRVNGES